MELSRRYAIIGNTIESVKFVYNELRWRGQFDPGISGIFRNMGVGLLIM